MRYSLPVVAYFIPILIIFSMVFMPFQATAYHINAQSHFLENSSPVVGDSSVLVNDTLRSLFGSQTEENQDESENNPESLDSNNANATDSSSGGFSLLAMLFGEAKVSSPDNVILAKVKNNDSIYAIVDGKKRLIPTMDIFSDYGYRLEWIEEITQDELDRFPKARLLQVSGDKKKTYYLTDTKMVRLIPNKKIFDSYGNRLEDVVVVSEKEFNYYPRNQFVFLDNSSNRDVYQIVDGKTKRYMTPMAIQRLKTPQEHISPINQVEFDFYKIDKPIVN